MVRVGNGTRWRVRVGKVRVDMGTNWPVTNNIIYLLIPICFRVDDIVEWYSSMELTFRLPYWNKWNGKSASCSIVTCQGVIPRSLQYLAKMFHLPPYTFRVEPIRLHVAPRLATSAENPWYWTDCATISKHEDAGPSFSWVTKKQQESYVPVLNPGKSKTCVTARFKRDSYRAWPCFPTEWIKIYLNKLFASFYGAYSLFNEISYLFRQDISQNRTWQMWNYLFS